MAVPVGGGWEGWVSCLNWRDPRGGPCGRRLGGLGVLSKLERPPWRFLGEAAGRVGVSCPNWETPMAVPEGGGWEGWGVLTKSGDPHGGSWGRRLGGLGCPI